MIKKIISITLAITAAAAISGCVENSYYSDSQYQQDRSFHRSNRYNVAPPSTTSGFYMGHPPEVKAYKASTSAPPSTTSQPAPAPAPVPASDNTAPPSTTSSANTPAPTPAGNSAPPSAYGSSTN